MNNAIPPYAARKDTFINITTTAPGKFMLHLLPVGVELSVRLSNENDHIYGHRETRPFFLFFLTSELARQDP